MNPSVVLTAFYPGTEWSCGNDYESLEWLCSMPKPTIKELSERYDEAIIFHALWNIRVDRNKLLVASDWTQVNDAPVNQKAWAEYRQALRDLPASITDPTQPITWPEPPK